MSDFVRRKGDLLLIVALAGGNTIRHAASVAGVAEKTVARRLEDAGFRQRVQDCRSALVERALGKLARASARAVNTLSKLLKSESDTARLGAARTILEIGNRLRESVEIERRVAELETKIGGRKS